MIFTVHQAKTQLSKLIALAEAGEEVVIARGDSPAVKLTPVEAPVRKKRVPGRLKGQIALTDAFFEPLPDDELARWAETDQPHVVTLGPVPRVPCLRDPRRSTLQALNSRERDPRHRAEGDGFERFGSTRSNPCSRRLFQRPFPLAEGGQAVHSGRGGRRRAGPPARSPPCPTHAFCGAACRARP